MGVPELKLKKVINASGRMSILGVSTLSDRVVEAMKYGGQHYWEMSDLVEKSGTAVAKYVGAEDAVIVNSASSGIALSVAAVITKDNLYAAEKLHQVAHSLPNEILIAKGHNVNYGAPIETIVNLGGGTLKEIGSANLCKGEQIEQAITEKTAGILYVKSHHCVQKGMPSIEEVSQIAKKYSLPLIIDAAAEEELEKYTKVADFAIFSGSKALEGPTSGIVAGKKECIDYIQPHLKGIGRAMKVGKESIFGLLEALEQYQTKGDSVDKQLETLNELTVLNNVDGIKVSNYQDEAGRPIYRGRISIDESKTGISAVEVIKQLQQGEFAIYTRDYYASAGHFDIDPRPLINDDIHTIVNRLKEIVTVKSE